MTSNQPPEQLSSLFGLSDEKTDLWHSDELGDILEHQLSAPLVADLQDYAAESRPIVDRAVPGGEAPQTFDDLLHQGEPHIELLTRAKSFARSVPDEQLPPPVRAVLYVAIIAAGIVHAGCRITEFDDDALHTRISWALGQSWVDSRTRQLLIEAAVALE